MQHFTEEDVRRLLPMTEAIAAMRGAFEALARGEAQNQPRRRLFLPSGSVLHSMAGAYGRYFGTKIYSTNRKHGAWFTFLLYDAETARPLAEFEANYLGQIRTGAVSGLAADLLAAEQSIDVGVIGSGFQARSQLEAVAAVREVRSVRVWSRSEEKRKLFVEELRRSWAMQAEAATDAADAVREAHVVITATNSKDPVVEHDALRSDALVLAMGSNDPFRRELTGELVRQSRVIVDDVAAARIEAGDLLLALEEEAWSKVTSLADVVSGKAKPHQDSGQIVFKSVGLGIEDVAAAAFVYERYS